LQKNRFRKTQRKKHFFLFKSRKKNFDAGRKSEEFLKSSGVKVVEVVTEQPALEKEVGDLLFIHAEKRGRRAYRRSGEEIVP